MSFNQSDPKNVHIILKLDSKVENGQNITNYVEYWWKGLVNVTLYNPITIRYYPRVSWLTNAYGRKSL